MRLKRRAPGDLVSWLCDLDRHETCSGVVAVNPPREGGSERERSDGFGLRVCACRAAGCTCSTRANVTAVRAAIRDRLHRLEEAPMGR